MRYLRPSRARQTSRSTTVAEGALGLSDCNTVRLSDWHAGMLSRTPIFQVKALHAYVVACLLYLENFTLTLFFMVSVGQIGMA